MGVQGNRLADDIRISAIFFLPKRITQDGSSRASSLILSRSVGPADVRTHAQSFEELAARPIALYGASFAADREIEPPRSRECRNRRENILAVAHFLPYGVGVITRVFTNPYLD